MTITEQLDELERKAQLVRDAGWSDVSADHGLALKLVAIARAALAWRDAKQQATRPNVTEDDRRLIAALREVSRMPPTR